MLNIPNPLNVPADVLLRELCEHVPAPVRDTLEAWHDAAEDFEQAEDNARTDGYETARDEYQPGHEAWRELFDVWEDACASGRWPCPEPDDSALAAAMADDIRKGAEALALCKELAAMPGRFPAGVRDKLAELLAD